MWKAYVRDFVINVIQEPVFVAGNSIGGVIPANACADHPHLFKGLALLNTAGSTDLDYDPDNPKQRKEQAKLFVNLTSWFVFNFLQRGIGNQLKRLYPVRPFNADQFLNAEIYRASCDPCALQVWMVLSSCEYLQNGMLTCVWSKYDSLVAADWEPAAVAQSLPCQLLYHLGRYSN
jgi:pimeloyl-ACP methyl ester carboxylesterase